MNRCRAHAYLRCRQGEGARSARERRERRPPEQEDQDGDEDDAGSVVEDARLVELSGTSAFAGLRDGLRAVLSQPLFVLGLLFILVVYFAPAGLTGFASGRRLFIRRRETP